VIAIRIGILIFGLCLVGMKFDPLRGSSVFALSVTFCSYNNNNSHWNNNNNHKKKRKGCDCQGA